ncbi:MAG: His/Gly/Thr/Pro-type tRNA ligase C-terminal domain-containing protein, partial [Haloarculaceae archaeon]
QVRVLPVTDGNLDYAEEVRRELENRGFRATVEDRDQTVGRKIRGAHDDRVPYMLIVGDDEEAANTVSVRDRQERERKDVDPAAFYDHLEGERDGKRVGPDFLAD